MSAPAAGGSRFSSGECSMIRYHAPDELVVELDPAFLLRFLNTLSMNAAVASLLPRPARRQIFVRSAWSYSSAKNAPLTAA